MMNASFVARRLVVGALLLSFSVSAMGSALADGFSQVYNTSGSTYTPRLKPIDSRSGYGYGNGAYNASGSYTSYHQPSSAYEQPTIYGYDRRQYPPAQTGILTRVENGVRDIWHSRTLRKGVVGAGAGVGLAGLAGRNLAKGSLVGAGVGLGVSAIDNEEYFNRHPMVRRTSKGALIGLGAAAVTGAAALLPAAAVGAGIGAGIHYITKP